MNFPQRFFTGVRNTTIPNPAWLHDNFESNEFGRLRRQGNIAKTFQGLCSDYNFKKQTRNFLRLRKVLLENDTDFLYVAAAKYSGDLHTNHRFVACAADGSLLWNKYVGFVAQGGQNHVYVAGMRIKVSVFLSLRNYEQRALLSGSRKTILVKVDPSKLWSLDEADDLWN